MPKPPNQSQRGSVHKESAIFVAAWIPSDVVVALDLVVREQDTDRSKLIRKALRRYLSSPESRTNT